MGIPGTLASRFSGVQPGSVLVSGSPFDSACAMAVIGSQVLNAFCASQTAIAASARATFRRAQQGAR